MRKVVAVDEELYAYHNWDKDRHGNKEERRDAPTQHVTSAAAFNVTCPPVGNLLHLFDHQCCEELLSPILGAAAERQRACLPFTVGNNARVTRSEDAWARIDEAGIERCHSVSLSKQALY